MPTPRATADPPLHLVLEFVRAEDAESRHAAREGAEHVYLLREPDGSGRYQEGVFRWSAEVLADLERLDRVDELDGAVRRLGDAVVRFLGAVAWARYEAQASAALAGGRRVVVTLRSAAAELYSLPWELLPIDGRPLCALPDALLRYEWPADEPAASGPAHVPPLGSLSDPATSRADPLAADLPPRGPGSAAVSPGSIPAAPSASGPTTPSAQRPDAPAAESGRVLFAWSAAGGALPVGDHQSALWRAARVGGLEHDPTRDVLPHASLDALCRKLAQRPDVSVVHLFCHGVALSDGEAYGLALNPSQGLGSVDRVDPERFGEALRPFAHRLRLLVLCSCQGANTGDLDNPLGSAATAAHRAGVEAVVASRYPLSLPGSTRITATLFHHLLVELTSLEAAFTAARDGERAVAGSFDWAALQLFARGDELADTRPVQFRPYRGLLALDLPHRRFFFGRERERQALRAQVDALLEAGRPRFLLVAGASGCGKSSLVRAGLLPDLAEADPPWRPLVLRPGEIGSPEALRARVGAGRVALLVDQLEELFTRTPEPARAPALRALWSLARGTEPEVIVLGAIRVEFLGRFGELTQEEGGDRFDTVAFDERHRALVPQLAPDQIEAVMRGPADRVGLRFEAGLIERLRRDVGRQPGALPLLSYTLDQLWQRRRGRWLTDAAYDALGGLGGALQRRADEVVAALGAPSLPAVRRLLVSLVDPHDEPERATRRRRASSELRPADSTVFDAVVERLVDERLLTRDDDALEIAHEALIREWPQLQGWLREDRAMMQALASLEGWTAQWRAFGTLLRGPQLGYAVQVRDRYPDAVDADTRALIAASEAAAAEATTRRRRRVRTVVGASVGAAAVFALLGAVAWLARDRAEREAERANAEAHRAELAAAAERTERERATREAVRARDIAHVAAARRSDPTTAVALLREVEHPGETPGWTQSVLDLGHEVVSRVVVRAATGAPSLADDRRAGPGSPGLADDVRAGAGSSGLADDVRASLSPGGAVALLVPAGAPPTLRDTATGRLIRELAAREVTDWAVGDDPTALGHADGTITLWSAKAATRPETRITAHGRPVTRVRLSPDGHTLLSAAGPEFRLWRLDDPPRAVRVGDAGGDVELAEPDPTGATWALTARGSPVILLVSADGSGTAERLLGHEGPVRDLAFGPDGRLLASASADTTARLWAHGAEVQRLAGHQDEVRDVDFSPDGRWLVSASWDGTARVWVTDGSRGARVLPGDGGLLESAAFSDEGDTVVVGAHDGALHALAVDGREEPTVLRGHRAPAQALRFAPGALVSAARDGTARRWTGPFLPFRALGPGVLQAAAATQDGRRLALAYDGRLRLLSPDGAQPAVEHDTTGLGLHFLHVELDAGGTRALTVAAGGALHLWPDRSGAAPVRLAAGGIARAHFSPDGARIVAAASDGAVRLWHGDAAPVALTGHTGPVADAVFSPDGARIASASADGTARVWTEGADGAPIVVDGAAAGVRVVRFSPDGTRVALGGDDGSVKVAPVDGSAPTVRLWVARGRVSTLAFSADGARVAAGFDDGGVRVASAAGGGEATVLVGHEAAVTHLEAWAGGFVSTALDETIRLWPATGDPLVLRSPADRASERYRDGMPGLLPVALAPDGSAITTLSQEGSLRTWPLRADALLAVSWQATDECLSVAGRRALLGDPPDVAAARLATCRARAGR